MTAAVPRACVMGHPVAHSRSPLIHGHWLAKMGIAGAYDLKDLTPPEFPDFLTHIAAHGYVGGNVTVPHKEAAFQLVDRRDDVAEAIGAVNTIWLEGSTLMGGNSDVHGFLAHLDDTAPGWNVPACRAVVLGAGGSARSAAYGLISRGVDVSCINRTVARAHTLSARFGVHVHGFGYDAAPQLLPEADLLVNCTSLGMTGMPRHEIDLAALKPTAVVYDIVYVPLETALLADARARGHRVVDGLGMLLQQAGYGFRKWYGATPTVTHDLRALIEGDLRTK